MQTIEHDENNELSLWSAVEIYDDYFILKLPSLNDFKIKYEYLDLILDHPEKLNSIDLTEEQKYFWINVLPELANTINEKYELYQKGSKKQ